MKRRSFLTSIVAALAMSTLLCRMAKAFSPEVPDIPVEEQQSTWDGTLSPNFLKKYKNSTLGAVWIVRDKNGVRLATPDDLKC